VEVFGLSASGASIGESAMSKKSSGLRRVTSRFVAGTEQLETRRMLSSPEIERNGEVVVVRGSDQDRNTVDVVVDGSNLVVTLTVRPDGSANTVLTETYPLADVLLVKIRGGSKPDIVNVSESYLGNTRINGRGGDDQINGGGGTDRIAGGKGNDVINGRGGNDRIHGEDGSDSIYGNAGNDILWGGRGDDLVDGGEGNDVLGGVLGTGNTLTGGAGEDLFLIKVGGAGQITDLVTGTDRVRTLPTGQGDIITPPTV
jgi:Ca2+-binding RTX toxin-like protein